MLQSRVVRTVRCTSLFLSKEVTEDDKIDKIPSDVDTPKAQDFTPLATADQLANKDEESGFDFSKVHWTSW